MSRNTEPRRGVLHANVELLDKKEAASYQTWYKNQPKQALEEIPNNELGEQMNNREPYYDFGDSADFAIKNEQGQFIAGGSVLILLFKDKQIGELTGVYVNDQYRRQGLATEIGKKRMAWCENQGFEGLQTHIASTNIPSLAVKFKEGFFLKDVSAKFDPAKASCLLFKGKNAPLFDEHSSIDIPLSDTRRLQEFTRSGFVGVDMRCTKKEETMEPADWNITLKKTI